MGRILTASIQIPKPPPNRTLKALERQQHQRKQVEAKVDAVFFPTAPSVGWSGLATS